MADPNLTWTVGKQKHEIDPVARSVAKPDAFTKPGTIGNQSKPVRFRPLNWKQPRGRPRKHAKDYRDVTYY